MDSDQSKLFVGGISRETSEDTLREHFSNYGTVLGSVIARERSTKTPRGFGFVWFSDPSTADKALRATHVILGRTVEVKKAIPRSEQQQNHQKQQQQQYCTNESQNGRLSKNSCNVDVNNHVRTKKIFVGGLSSNLTEEEFKNYFKTFGMITDVVVMHDNMTNRPRGFGFVTFDSEESVEKVMLKTFHELNGRLVEVKRAVPKEEINGGSSTCSYNSRGGVVKDSYNCYQPGNYPPYSPGYGYPPVYAIPGYSNVGGYIPGAGIFGAGYPMVPYGKFGYGITSIAPRSPWYGPVMIGTGAFPIPYGNASVFPAYVNGGAGGYNGIVNGAVDGKLSQVLGGSGHPLPNATPSQTEAVKLDVDSMGLKGSNESASSDQNQKVLDGRFNPLPVGISG